VSVSPLAGLAEVLRLVWIYFERFLWPRNLAAVYRFPPAKWNDYEVLCGLALVTALLGAVAYGLLRRKSQYAVPALWYLCGIATVGYSALTTRFTLAWDHYLYLASVGLIMYVHGGLTFIVTRLTGSAKGRAAAVAGWIALLCVLFLPSIAERNRAWSGNLNLWSDAVRKSPTSQVAHFNLGYTLWESGDIDGALLEYRKAVELAPDYVKALFNLAHLLEQRGEYQEAEDWYRRVIRINPGNDRALLSLGGILAWKGMNAEAEALYRKVLALNVGNRFALMRLANVLMAQGRYTGAAEAYREVLRINPRSRSARTGLEKALSLARGAYPGETR
jgi:tetratricopeptide (TPR) repeat protein